MTVSEEVKTVLDECQARHKKAAAMSDAITAQETLIDGLVASGKSELAKIEFAVFFTLCSDRLALADESIAALEACLLKHESPPTDSSH